MFATLQTVKQNDEIVQDYVGVYVDGYGEQWVVEQLENANSPLFSRINKLIKMTNAIALKGFYRQYESLGLVDRLECVGLALDNLER